MELRAVATQLVAQYGDTIELYRGLDKVVGIETAYVNRLPFVEIVNMEGLVVALRPPYLVFREGISEALRKREPVDRVPLPLGVTISIVPTRIDALDIIKVILERDGKQIEPLASSLRPSEFATQLGAKTTLHSGTIIYPCTAFLPDAKVVVTAIPEIGSNTVKAFTPTELVVISAAKDRMAARLVGLDAAAVQEQYGNPSRVDGKRWNYVTDAGGLYVYLGDGDKVTSVEPSTFDLKSIKPRSELPLTRK